MYTKRDLLVVLAGAATGAACVLLLLPPSPWGGGVTAEQELALLGCNGQPGVKNEHDTLVLPPSSSQAPDAAHYPFLDDKRNGDLRELLGRAAMVDKTVIVTFTNEAWAAPGSLMDLFLASFRMGIKTQPLLKHLVVVAVDAEAFQRCRQVHPLCYSLPGAGGNGSADFSSEQPYMAKDYLDMMWLRNRFQARILDLGFSFVFTDVDIVWFRNPLLRVPVGADIAVSSDRFYGDNPYDLSKDANGGFVYARSSARTAAFFADWYAARAAFPGDHEQAVFDKVKRELSRRHGVTVQFVDTAYLGGFCQPARDFHKLCTFHGNCVKGLRKKLKKLRRIFQEWKQFRISNAALMD